MQHFTHFGSFEADFGYVKQANKALKNLNDLQGAKIAVPTKSRLTPATIEKGLGNIAESLDNPSRLQKNSVEER